MKEFLLLYSTALVYIFRDFLKVCFSFIVKSFVSGVEVKSNNSRKYALLSDYLLGLNSKQLKYNIEKKKYWNINKISDFNSIADGSYLVYLSLFTWGLVTKKVVDNSFEICEVLSIKICGLNRREHFRIVENFLSAEDSNKYIPCFNGDGYIEVNKRFKNSIVFEGRKDFFSKVEGWKNNKKYYEDLGIPHKLGILLYGEPGTGKSSLARVIATELGYSLYYLNFRAYKDPQGLLRALTNISPNSVILLEDIDCIIGNRESENVDNIFNIALNFVDGVLSPRDCIIVATTNYLDRLDKAFVRPGRFDMRLEMKPLEYNEAKELCDIWGVDIQNLNIDLPINASKLQSILLQKGALR